MTKFTDMERPSWMPEEYTAQWQRHVRRWGRREADFHVLRLIILRERDQIAWEIWMHARALDPTLADAVRRDMSAFVRLLRRHLPDLPEILPVWMTY